MLEDPLEEFAVVQVRHEWNLEKDGGNQGQAKKKKKNQIERYKECKTDKTGGLEFER